MLKIVCDRCGKEIFYPNAHVGDIVIRFALKDITIIEDKNGAEAFVIPRKGCHRPIGSLCDGVCDDCPYWYISAIEIDK